MREKKFGFKSIRILVDGGLAFSPTNTENANSAYCNSAKATMLEGLDELSTGI